jgi:thiamine biosynthesis lipoprotein
MAVDAALERLRLNGIGTAMVNAGGDLAVLGLPPDAEQWPVAVPGQHHLWTIPLRRGSIATSGIARRHWWQGQTLRHHLLDPRTGLPAQSDLWSVTVIADRCEQAEVAAKSPSFSVRRKERFSAASPHPAVLVREMARGTQ